jgi:hypothetical protein
MACHTAAFLMFKPIGFALCYRNRVIVVFSNLVEKKVDIILETLNSSHSLVYRVIILSVNSRFALPVGSFVLLTYPTHSTSMTSRCPTILKHLQTAVLMNSRTIYVLYNRN